MGECICGKNGYPLHATSCLVHGAYHEPDSAPYGKLVLLWLFLPKNPSASGWTLASRCYVTSDENPAYYEQYPHLRRTVGCWWSGSGGRYYSKEHAICWTDLPDDPPVAQAMRAQSPIAP